jgi:hypothetical protein
MSTGSLRVWAQARGVIRVRQQRQMTVIAATRRWGGVQSHLKSEEVVSGVPEAARIGSKQVWDK